MEPEIDLSSEGIGENEAFLASDSREDWSTRSIILPTNNGRPQNLEATTWSAPGRASMTLQAETKTSFPSSAESPDSLLSKCTKRTPAASSSEDSDDVGDGSRLSARAPFLIPTENCSVHSLHSSDSPYSDATAGRSDVGAIRIHTQQPPHVEVGEGGLGVVSGPPVVRRGVPPAMIAAARVSARLVSASGPVANGTAARWRQAAAAFSTARSSVNPLDLTGGGASRHGSHRGGQGLAVQRTLRESGERGRRRAREGIGRQRMWRGETQGAQERVEREAGESGPNESIDETAGEEVSGEPSGASSSGGESESAAVMEPAPADIRRALASSHNTIALLLLLLVHYVVTHAVSIAAFFVGTVLLFHLDRRLRSHADAQVLKSMFNLVGVAVTSALTIGVSASMLSKFPEGEGLLYGLLLKAPKPIVSHISAVVRRTVIVDLWARFLSVIVKAVLALLSARDPNSGSGNVGRSAATCVSGRLSSWGGLHRCRRCFDSSQGGGRDRTRLGASLRRDHEGNGGGSTGDYGYGSQDSRSTRRSCGARRRFCGASRWFRRGQEPRRVATYSGNERGDGVEGEPGRGREGERSTVMFSRAGRQRRVSALVEMIFLLYRCVLPVPVWIEFYSRDGGYFAAIYLVLKGMEVSFRTDRLTRAACYICRGDLDRGKFATPEEVAEAGSPDCPICYERMERPLLLPCQHLFCVECVAEWLDRECTCPLCRAEVPTSNPIPKTMRDGRTTVIPQIL